MTLHTAERTPLGARPAYPTVGVLGGMGPLATAAFYQTLIRMTQATKDQDHIPVLIDGDPLIPDRSAFLLERGLDPRPLLISRAQRLEGAGASLIVIPCNTANAFRNEIQVEVSVPVLPWLEVTADAAELRGFRVVGILATEGTIHAGLYQKVLKDRGITGLAPGKHEQRLVSEVIFGTDGIKASGHLNETQREGVVATAASLVARGAEAIILGCTELAIAIPARNCAWPIPIIDPAEAAALEVITRVGAIPAVAIRSNESADGEQT